MGNLFAAAKVLLPCCDLTKTPTIKMKNLFMLLLAAVLIGTSCNNNKAKTPADKTGNNEKDDYLNGNDKNGGLFGNKDDNNENNENNGSNDDNGNWSSSDVKKFNDECQSSLEKEGVEGTMITQICSCWFDKVKRKYETFKEADSDHSGAHEQMIKDCISKIANAANQNGNNDDGNNNMSGGWSSSDRNSFVKDCKSTAVEKVGEAGANRYCNCMLGKLEGMYSTYSEANRKLGNATQEQINSLAEDCNR